MTEERKAQISHSVMKFLGNNIRNLDGIKAGDVVSAIGATEDEITTWIKDLIGIEDDNKAMEFLFELLDDMTGDAILEDSRVLFLGHIICPECKEGVLHNFGGIMKCSVCTITQSTGSDTAPPQDDVTLADTRPICGGCGHSVQPLHDMGGIVRCPNCHSVLSVG